MKDYIFIKRKHQVHAGWLVLLVILVFLYASKQEYQELELRKALKYCKEVQEFQKEQPTHIWQMSKTCSDQLLNSADGILRIKIK
jgi:hypothetical protein